MMGYGYGYGFPMFWMMVIPTILLIAIAFALYKVFSSGTHNNHHRHIAGNAVDLLNERYAKGEIDDEEYRRKKQLLSKP